MNARDVYDLAVIGTGAVGSAALWRAAGRGLRSVGFDRFPPGHDRGSSHGETRIIRLAYFEHPDYVPLLRTAYALWDELEKESSRRLFHQVGLLQVGPPAGHVVQGVLESARKHALAVDEMTAVETMRRFPLFRVSEAMVGLFEPTAGYLLVEECVKTCFAMATARGAEFRQSTVRSWRKASGAFEIETDAGVVTAAKLVVSPGAWALDLVPGPRGRFVVLRKPLHWFETNNPSARADRGCPTFFFERPEGEFYGFPQIDAHGLKAAEHTGGSVVADPLTDRRPGEVDADDLARVRRFADQAFVGVGPKTLRHDVCLYTMSPDSHFVVDRLDEGVAYAAGLSGHGFKFAPALGEALVELAVEGRTRSPVEFLSAARFSD